MRSLLLFFVLLPCSLALNIMMYAMIGGPSHERFAEKLINLLNQHGHTVDVIFGMVNAQATLKDSYAVRKMVTVPFPGENDWGSANPILLNPFQEVSDWYRLKLQQNKFSETAEQFCDALLDSTDVADLLSSNKYDIGLISGYDMCPFGLAYHYQISPVVSYVATPLLNTQYYYGGLPELPLYENAVFLESHQDRSSFTRRILESWRMIRDRYNHYKAHSAVTEKLRTRVGIDFPDIREIALNTSLDFCNSHQLVEEPKPMSHRVRYIGGIGRAAPKPLSKELDAMLNLSKKGTVYFSFGTQITPDKINEKLMRVFVSTFKRFSDYNFLWKFDGKTLMNTTNIFNSNWLPQTDLLHDSRVVAFISHMGLNSFTETAYAGVPVVAIPLFAEQIHNAKRAKAIGIGEIIKSSEITEENLYNALAKVLFDERYRNLAREIAEMIAAQPDTPQRTFIEGIEYAAKFKNLASHYRLAGADYHFLAQIGWDVVALFTVVSLIVVYATLKLIFITMRVLIRLTRRKIKTD